MGEDESVVDGGAGRAVSRRTVLCWLGGAGLAGATGLLAGCTHPAGPSPSSGSVTEGTRSTPVVPSSSGPAGSTLAELSARLSRPLLLPGSPGYAAAARLYNPRFDAVARPAAIARCGTVEDVAACVRFAAGGGAPLAVRSGGHSYGGWSSGPGLQVDLSGLAAVSVDSTGGLARIGAGARLVDVYAAVAAGGAALAAGSCPTVGMAGLALGGGIGVLARAYGLTCDAVRAVEVVTADGAVRTVDVDHDPDLFWALRGGGGGSFGVVTAFTVALRPAPTVHTFYLRWPFDAAAQVLAGWQGWVGGADGQLWSSCKLLVQPASDGGRATVSGTWLGPADRLQAQLQPLLTAVGRRPDAQQALSLNYADAMLLEAGWGLPPVRLTPCL